MDVAHFKTKLLARLAEIEALAEQGAAAAATVELDQSRVGRLSRMDAMQNQAMARATATRRAHELSRVRAALERIESGDFGYCAECGDTIPDARLEIEPAAVVCVRCAESRERRG